MRAWGRSRIEAAEFAHWGAQRNLRWEFRRQVDAYDYPTGDFSINIGTNIFYDPVLSAVEDVLMHGVTVNPFVRLIATDAKRAIRLAAKLRELGAALQEAAEAGVNALLEFEQCVIPADGVRDAVVGVETSRPSGTGFLCAWKSGGPLLLTAAHVLGDATEVVFKTVNGQSARATVGRVDRDRDLAVLYPYQIPQTARLLPVPRDALVKLSQDTDWLAGGVNVRAVAWDAGSTISVAQLDGTLRAEDRNRRRLRLNLANPPQGASGAPVFAELPAGYFLFGVLLGRRFELLQTGSLLECSEAARLVDIVHFLGRPT